MLTQSFEDVFWRDESPEPGLFDFATVFLDSYQKSFQKAMANLQEGMYVFGVAARSWGESNHAIGLALDVGRSENQTVFTYDPCPRKYGPGTDMPGDLTQASTDDRGRPVKPPAACPRHGEVMSGGFCRKCSR